MAESERPGPLSPAVEATELEPADLSVAAERPSSRFLNREASWLDFDERVLGVADRRSLPVLERAKFFAIFSDNLDDFFQVRVGSLRMRLEAGVSSSGSDDESVQDRLGKINERVQELAAARDVAFSSRLVPDLAAAGIRLSDW